MAQTLTKIIKNAVEGKHYLLVAGATLAILAPFQAAQAVTVVVGTGTAILTTPSRSLAQYTRVSEPTPSNGERL